MLDLNVMGQAAKAASRQMNVLSTLQKNAALRAIAEELEANTTLVLEQNALDVADANAKGLSAALIDRLLLNEQRIAALADDTRRIIDLPDPVGKDIESRVLPTGLRLSKRRIPIGVIGVIYEARPNVTIDIATLALKSGNVVILRGGSETLRTNLALTSVIQSALRRTGLPQTAVQYISEPDRALITALLRLDAYVDMIIPRGGAALHHLCKEQSTIPVITGGIGICHLFVDDSADLRRAGDIIENSKVRRPSVCNALDTLLVHRAVAPAFLPDLAARLIGQYQVELRTDAEAQTILNAAGYAQNVILAGPDDFDQEWLALILGVKIVSGIDEALQHIYAHSSEHTESILTNTLLHATRFVNEINSAVVFVNASTWLNDGGQFGLGAEVAISTQKLHARGPMGLEELTTYKWIGMGDGHIRS
jgi:glutamate-5-semialdehyde dehydrogenase